MQNMGGVCEAVKETQIQKQLGRCAFGLDGLEGAVKDLEKRLEAILCPEPPSKVSEGKPEQTLVFLATTIKSFADRICFLTDRITELKSRIEL